MIPAQSVYRTGVVAILFAACVAWMGLPGCGGGGDGSSAGASDGSAAGADAAASDAPTLVGDGGSFGDASNGGALSIVPATVTLDVQVGSPLATQTFTAQRGSTAVTAAWSLDAPGLGTIDASGVFHSSGTQGGVLHVVARANGQEAKALLTVNLHWTENTGNVPVAGQTALQGGGAADASFRWLYPYDKTVWPLGLKAPLLQFDGAAGDTYLVEIDEPRLSYKGYFGASSPSTVQLAAPVWDAVTRSAAAGDKVTVKATKSSGGKVTGPASETWTVAPAQLKGSVYYDTYDPISGVNGQGGILRVPVGGDASLFLRQDGVCTVCHSVSARGNVLVTNVGLISSPDYSAAYDLTQSGPPLLGPKQASTQYAFGALSPDGKVLLSELGGYVGLPSTLFDVATGTKLADMQSVYGVSPYTPCFGADGTKVTFAKTQSGAVLSMLDYDPKAQTFSNLRDIYTDTASGSYPRWPVLTPDNAGVVFQRGASDQGETRGPNTGDLYYLDLASLTTVRLDALDGYDAAGNPDLPRGGMEIPYTYEPTMLPVSVGGYSWVIFTSRRMYGNQITSSDPFATTGSASAPARKKIWLAPLDLGAKAGTDPSHPAIYLDGQDLVTANLRAFVALDPCKGDGQSCAAGYECCNGACQENGQGQFVCGTPSGSCAPDGDACHTASDCCSSTSQCIAGYCSPVTPQ